MTVRALMLVALVAQESATVTKPLDAGVTITSYQIAAVSLAQPVKKPEGWKPARNPNTGQPLTFPSDSEWRLTIVYIDNLGNIASDEHLGVYDVKTNPHGADRLVTAWSTANLSTASLWRRALQHLIDEGKIPPSTISGSPVKEAK